MQYSEQTANVPLKTQSGGKHNKTRESITFLLITTKYL